jgi:serine protease AprX
LVLVRAADEEGRVSDATILRALRWVRDHADELQIRVVNISVTGDVPQVGGPIDQAVQELTDKNVIVVAAAGNSGERRLLPPATARRALTVGGLDDRNTLVRVDAEVWHSNFGETDGGFTKPEVVAPSVWVVAPLLPDTDEANRAKELFERRRAGDESVEQEIAERKLVRPEYKLTEGTSFASPIVASIACCMLEANPKLTPADIHKLVISSAFPVPGASVEQQGAGAVDAGTAVALALRASKGSLHGFANSPFPHAGGVRFVLFRSNASRVEVRGSWNDWGEPGLEATQLKPGIWIADLQGLPPGRYTYKFLIDGTEWLYDPSNSRKAPDGSGRFNSVLIIPGLEAAAKESTQCGYGSFARTTRMKWSVNIWCPPGKSTCGM